jgi:beta-glucosidase
VDRRVAVKFLAGVGLIIPQLPGYAMKQFFNPALQRSDFGKDFKWGVSTAAFQIEGAAREDGKSESIWDRFASVKGKIKNNENADTAADFYHRYKEDVSLIRELNFDAFRFSLAWARILPNGTGEINQKGIDFYNRVIDACLALNIEPWVTLYHWDLPQALEEKGGWTNRDIVSWFSEYADVCTHKFGDSVKNWMILNEPLAFTALGYFLGIHAPGKKGLKNFLPAVHHTALCQAEGGRIAKKNVIDGHIGTTFSCSPVHPLKETDNNLKAAARFDALVNRLFIEPTLGMGYPVDTVPALKRIEKYYKEGDEQRLAFDFDFTGIQNYTREVVKYNVTNPVLWGKQVPAEKRNVEMTEMKWEVYPESIYEMIKKFSQYEKVKKIYVTENGAAFKDLVDSGSVHDTQRVSYFEKYLEQVLRAKKEGAKLNGYFVWSLVDNFEWAEGYTPRFGIVHVDFETQQRTIKDSGYWFRDFLKQ